MTKPVSPIFFYFLSTQFENYGDLVINRECLKLLRGAGQLVVNTSGVPVDFLAELGVTPDEKAIGGLRFLQQIIGAARSGRPTYFVLVPGAISGDLTRSQWARHLCLSVGYRALASLGVRIIRLGASMEPLSARREPIERWKSQAMHFIGLRDRLSLSAAHKGRLAHVSHFPDFAWMLPRRTHKGGRDVTSLLLSFRVANSLEHDDICRALSAYLRRVDPNASLSLTMVVQVDRDREPSRALAESIGGGRPIRYLDIRDGETALLDGYARAGGVLSNRLHVLMFAARQGAPIRAFVHSHRNQKIIGLFEDTGLGDRLVDITDQDAVERVPYPDEQIDSALFEKNRKLIEAQFAAMLK